MTYLKLTCCALLIAVTFFLIQEDYVTKNWIQSEAFSPFSKQFSPEIRESEPKSCGVYYFYHVGKTGGTSVRVWQERMTRADSDKVEFLDTFNMSWTDQKLWKETFESIEESIDTNRLSSEDKWLFVRHHHNTPGLRYTMPLIRKWRRKLEDQGCGLVTATVLREPIARAKSIVSYNLIGKEMLRMFAKKFCGASRYLLYNSCEPRDDEEEPEWCEPTPGQGLTGHYLDEKEIKQVLGYLREFDIVTKTQDLDEFVKKSEWLTMLQDKLEHGNRAPVKNKSTLDFEWVPEYTKMLESALREDQIVWEALFGADQGA